MSEINEPLHGRAGDEMRDRLAAARTVTVHTSDHGPVTIGEPAWCTGRHHQQGGYRVDISHTSADHEFNVATPDGPITIIRACFEQRPFTEADPGRDVFVNVELDGEMHPCDPAQLHRIAAALTAHSAHMVTLAAQLTDLREAGDE